MMTKEEIRIALGLLPFDEFREKVVKEYDPVFIPKGRRTGKTTEMLIEAVYNAQSGTVAMIGCTLTYSKLLCKEAIKICNQLGLHEAAENIVAPIPPLRKLLVVDKLYYDHHQPVDGKSWFEELNTRGL